MECILFGDKGCQFVCDVKCQLYGCSSMATCGQQQRCECSEVYEIDDKLVNKEYIKNWSFDEGWNFRFTKNAASETIKRLLQQEPRTGSAILTILRDPHITGTQVVNKLLATFPEADILKQLQPIVRGKIDLFVNANRRFNFDAFKAYIARDTTDRIDQLQDIEVRPLTDLEQFAKNEQLLKSLAKQLLLFPSPLIKTIVKVQVEMMGLSTDQINNITNLQQYTDNDEELTSQQIDEIIQSGALNQLLELEEIPKFPLAAIQPQIPFLWI